MAPTDVDSRLESAILDLLARRAPTVVGTQGGRVVDLASATGPIRIRRR